MVRARWAWSHDLGRLLRPVHRDLLRLVQPPAPQREDLLSERVAPALAEVGRTHAGRPAAEVLPALVRVVEEAGGAPDRRALAGFAARIENGENPFAEERGG